MSTLWLNIFVFVLTLEESLRAMDPVTTITGAVLLLHIPYEHLPK